MSYRRQTDMFDVIGGVLAIGIVLLIVAAFKLAEPIYEAMLYNKQCTVTYNGTTVIVPQNRVDTTSAGSNTKLIIYDSWFQWQSTEYTGNDVKVDCK